MEYFFWIALGLMLGFLVFAIIRFSFLVPATKGLPILMYHRFDPNVNDGLTVSVAKFEEHLNYLKENNYQPIDFQTLINFQNHKQKLPTNPILLTFDDGYVNNLIYAYPLLQKYGFKATIFLPSHYLGGSNLWGDGKDEILNYDQLELMDKNVIEYALHSHTHLDFKRAESQAIENEIVKNISTLNQHQIPFQKVLAYPYGSIPKNPTIKAQMLETFKKNGLEMALRIGNKVNRLPIRDLYTIKRIDIRGTDSFWEFKTKVRKGRVKLF
jgi:peptidoglycan/xylan/chitin deacetylase (PgdA/CDA1 family)